MNRLEPGTMCADCHCCEAVALVLGEPLCRSCRVGFPLCEKKRKAGIHPPAPMQPVRVQRGLPVKPSAAPREAKIAVATGGEPAPEPEQMQPTHKPKEMPVTVQGRKTAKEVIVGIQGEPVTLSNRAVGEKYGVSPQTVRIYRRKVGIMGKQRFRRAKPGPEARQDAEATEEKPRSVPASDEGDSHASSVQVRLDLTLDQLNSIWQRLSMDVKGVAIQAALEATV